MWLVFLISHGVKAGVTAGSGAEPVTVFDQRASAFTTHTSLAWFTHSWFVKCCTWLQDLAHHYANGWSLLGLERALQAALKQPPPNKEDALREELKAVQQQLSDAWKHAEVQLHSCCPALSKPWTL
jgi:hypothetical protein